MSIDILSNGRSRGQSRGALNLPYGRTMVLFGDSIEGQQTLNTTAPDQITAYQSVGYWNYANMAMLQSFKLVANCGISSQTTTQMLARLGTGVVTSAQPDPLAFRSSFITMGGGTNDIGAFVGTTRAAADAAAAVIIANKKSMINTIVAAGRICVLNTITPGVWCGLTTAVAYLQQYILEQVNQWTRDEAAYYNGVILFDLHRAVTDPTTGRYSSYGGSTLAKTSEDETHPNYQGSALAGSQYPNLANLVGYNDTSSVNLLDFNYCYNAVMAGSNASGTNNYVAGGTSTPTGTGPNATSVLNRNTGTCVVTPQSARPIASTYYETCTRLAIGAPAAYDGSAFLLGGDPTNATGRWDLPWAASTAYKLGDHRYPNATVSGDANAGLWAVCISAGTSGTAGTVTWPTTPGATVVDNGATWKMIPQVGVHLWVASKFVGSNPGLIIKPIADDVFYLQCTTSGQCGSSEPTWNTTVGGTTTDGTAVWTTISPTQFQYFAELEFFTSGLTANKGMMKNTYLAAIDTTGTIVAQGWAVTTDLSGGSGSGSRIFPVNGRLRTPVITVPLNKRVRYLTIQDGTYLDAGGSVNYDVTRPSIRAVQSYPL